MGTRRKVYILIVPRIVVQTGQLIDSMCKGIAARSKKGDNFLGDSTIVRMILSIMALVERMDRLTWIVLVPG